MAKVSKKSLLHGVTGQVGDLVIRQVYGHVVASLRPKETERVRDGAERANNSKFALAQRRAKATSPEMAARYLERSRREGTTATGVRTRDYLRPPEIERIDHSGYNGLPGDVILIRASDDFEVREVGVEIIVPGGHIFEHGRAVRIAGTLEARRGYAGETFVFLIRNSPAVETEVTIRVTAIDWAGNKTEREAQRVIPPRPSIQCSA